MKYDYFVAGRWRNYKNIRPIVEKLRASGKTVYCFIENEYDGDGVKNESDPEDVEALMRDNEALKDWQTNPTFRKIYETDMDGLKNSTALVLVFSAGFSAHMELGAAFGMGKKCYGIGQPEKAETLYFMFNQIFRNVDEMVKELA